MMNKIIDKFFYKLENEMKNQELSVSSITNVINETFKEEGLVDIKEMLIKRIDEHKACEKNSLEECEEPSFAVANYGGTNRSLECESCCTLIIDDEVLSSYIEE